MKKYLYIFIIAFFVGCGGGGSSSEDSNVSDEFELDEVFSTKIISPRDDLVSIDKSDLLRSDLEFPLEKELNNIEEIKEYLEEKYEISLASNPSIKKTLYFTSYKFIQTNENAKKCGSSINITLDENNNVFKTYIFKIDDFENCTTATSYFEKEREFEVLKAPLLSDGTLVETTIKLFETDPLTISKGELVLTNDFYDLEIPDTSYSLKTVQVLEKDGQVYFSNNRVQSVDLISRQSSSEGQLEEQDNQQGVLFSTNNFTENFDTPQFLEQMAFYHLNDSLSYLEKLGYIDDKSIFDAPLMFDAQVSSQNQSSYLTDIKLLTYGIGGSPDVVDADVIRHELGHAINYHIVSDFNDGDTGAISEGFSDYWAGFYSLFVQKDDDIIFEDDIVFNFDGNYGTNKTKRSLNNQGSTYNPLNEYRAHLKVAGVNADELWSTPLYTSLKDSINLYNDDAYDEINTILLESFAGMGYSVKMLQMANSIVKTANKLYPDKEYSKIFLDNFKKHNLILDKLQFTLNHGFISSINDLELSFSNIYFDDLENLNINISSNEIDIKTNYFEEDSFNKGVKQSKNLTYELKNDLECSQKINIDIKNNFNFKNQRSESISTQLSLTYGEPLFESIPIIENKIIPNAKETNNIFNPISTVPLTFVMNISKDEIIDDNFAFILELSSKDLSQIKVELISPDKEKISLISKESYSTTNLKKVFILSNEDKFKNLKNKNYKGVWYLNVENKGLDNETILYRYGINKIKRYVCN